MVIVFQLNLSTFDLVNCFCTYILLHLISRLELSTLSCVYLDTPRVFSTKTQHFTPMFLKSVVEVHLFLKGSELSKDKNSENPNFKHFHPETSVGQLLKVLQYLSTCKLRTEKDLQNFEKLIHRGVWIKMLET